MKQRRLFTFSKSFNLRLACFCFLVLVTGGCALSHHLTAATEPTTQRQTLRIGAIPFESIEKTQDQLQPLIEYLEKKNGFKVELIVSNDYRSVIDKMRLKEIDIAMFGPYSYILAHKQAGAQAFASTENTKTGKKYYSVFIAHPATGIENIQQLRGRRLAFTDRESTSGYLVPKAMLLKNGINPDKDLESVEFFEHHDASILAVKKRLVDAAAVSSTILQNMREKGLVGDKDYRIIHTSEAIPGSGTVWAYREGLSAVFFTKVKDALFSANHEEGALGIFATEVGTFFPVDDREYDVIRDTSHMLELDQE